MILVESPIESRDDLLKYCFSAAYLPQIITEGLGITLDGSKLSVVKSIDDSSIDWALGSVLYEVLRNNGKLDDFTYYSDLNNNSQQ